MEDVKNHPVLQQPEANETAGVEQEPYVKPQLERQQDWVQVTGISV